MPNGLSLRLALTKLHACGALEQLGRRRRSCGRSFGAHCNGVPIAFPRSHRPYAEDRHAHCAPHDPVKAASPGSPPAQPGLTSAPARFARRSPRTHHAPQMPTECRRVCRRTAPARRTPAPAAQRRHVDHRCGRQPCNFMRQRCSARQYRRSPSSVKIAGQIADQRNEYGR